MFAAWLLLIGLAAAGCATLAPTHEEIVPPEAGSPGSLRARAVVSLKQGASVSGRAAIVVESPDRFRIDVFGPLGHTAATIISDGTRLTVFSDGKLKTYRWDDPELPYSFTAEDVVSLLTGSGPAEGEHPDPYGRLVAYSSEAGENGRPARVAKSVEGTRVLSAELGDWRVVDGSYVPYRIFIDGGGQSMEIKYSSVEVAPEIGPELFEGPETR